MTAMRWPRSPPSTPAPPGEALKLIEVDYEVLPHVTDVDEAMKPDAPVLHDTIFTDGLEQKPSKPSNVTKRTSTAMATSRRASSRPISSSNAPSRPSRRTRAISSRMPAWRACSSDGTADLWVCTQGHFVYRQHCAQLLGMDVSQAARHLVGDRRRFRRQDPCLGRASRAGAVAQGGPAGQAGHDARRGVPRLRPDISATSIDVKIGARKDGTITAAEATLALFQAAPTPACGPNSAP